MTIYKLKSFYRGWFIGNFAPSVLKTEDFEVGILEHKKGEEWPAHFHEKSLEINYLIEGKMKIQNKLLVAGDIFVLNKYEIADPEFIEDCKLVVIKTPSVPGDKVLV